MSKIQNTKIITDLVSIIEASKNKAIRSVDFHRVQMYWYIGKRVFEEEQKGAERAEYGKYLTKYISEELEPVYGSGYSRRHRN